MERRTRLTGEMRDFRTEAYRRRGSFWVSAANYYLVTVFVAGILFLIVFGWLYDVHDETPWVVGALAAAAFAVGLVLFREVILRRIRQRAIAERRLSRHLRVSGPTKGGQTGGRKISIERNREILDDIRTKSEAANVLGGLADAHREVFEVCERYVAEASDELATARPGSPRIPALRKGLRLAAERHRFHMLKWAEIKAKDFSAEPGGSEAMDRKALLAREALAAVDRAIAVYPDERTLADSKAVLDFFLLSAIIRDSIDKAEQALAEGRPSRAIEYYRDALAELEKSELAFPERAAISGRIRSAIERLNGSVEA